MKANWILGPVMGMLLLGCGPMSSERGNRGKDPEERKVEVPQDPATNLAGEVDERIQRLVASGFPTLDDANAASFLSEWGQEQTENRVVMETKHGTIVVELFDDVPVHRANFLYKVHRRYFDPAEFTRVVPDFVVQGGNSEEERPQQLRFLIGQHTLPSEFQTHRLHTRGALAMSRSYHDNPDKRSSGYDFYIVTGRKIGAQELARVQHDRDWSYTKEQSKAYASMGGAPHLDGEHTVFGRVVTGMEVVDRLAATPRDASDWPVERLEVTMQWEEESP